jgi:pimeloyl-ACP methyl ester carboxylesterase
LFGRSLGGAVALQLAASDSEARQKQLDRHQRPPPPLAGVIIENSFSTLRDMVFVLATRMGLLRPQSGTNSPEQAETNANAAAQAQEESMERRQQRQRQQRDAEASPQSPLSAAAEEDVEEEDDDERGAASEIVPVPAALPVGAGGPGSAAGDAGSSFAGGEGLLRRMLRFVLHLLMTSRWDSVSAVRRMDPSLALLFISGLMDELVPAAHMAQLHAEAMAMHEAHVAATPHVAANVAPIAALRTLHTVERGGHNDTHARGGLLYFHTIARFFHDAHHRAQELQRRQQAASFAAAINAAEAL